MSMTTAYTDRIADLEHRLADLFRVAAHHQDRADEAERQLAEARAALEWYAGDGSTYDGIDVGQRARAVLQRL